MPVLVGVQSCSRSLIQLQRAVNVTKAFCILSGMYVGFVARELLGQSTAVRITVTQGSYGKHLEGNRVEDLGVGGRILERVRMK